MLKLLEKIGAFFSGLFNAAKKTWKKLSPQVQEAMIKASKIVDIINKNVQQPPPFVIDLIKKQFPDLDIESIQKIVQAVATDLHIAQDTNTDDLEALIKKLQDLLATTRAENGTTWAKISHTAYLAIAVLLAPAGTKLAALVSLAEYVYHDLIKGGD